MAKRTHHLIIAIHSVTANYSSNSTSGTRLTANDTPMRGETVQVHILFIFMTYAIIVFYYKIKCMQSPSNAAEESVVAARCLTICPSPSSLASH